MPKHLENKTAHALSRQLKAARDFPGLSPAEVYAKADTPEYMAYGDRYMLRLDFVEKMTIQLGDRDWACEVTPRLYDNLPDELLPNIIEWCDNKDLSDINYKGMTLNKMRLYDGVHTRSMYDVLTAFASWQKLGCPDANDFLRGYFRTA